MHDAQQKIAVRLSEAQAQIQPGARYHHYKNKNQAYKVLLIALREKDCEPCVVYQAEYGERLTFIRPVKNWLETSKLTATR